MSRTTNRLVNGLRKILLPVFALVATLVGISLFAGHSPVKAAHAAASRMDDDSVSSLVSLDQAVEAVATRVTPAVVNVAVTSRNRHAEDGDDQGPDDDQGQGNDQQQQFFRFFGQGARPTPQIEHGIGSGVIVSPDGYIVTNEHVVDGAVEIRVTLNDRRILPAKLIGRDKLTDLAVIKVNATDLPSIPWGDSTRLHPGQTVLAFGSPFGFFQFSVTRGIVSALNRPNPFANDLRKPGGFIQTDAAINRGNSGGPLVDSHGEVIGINTFLISDSGSFAGAGFAIPSQIARPTVEALIKNGVVHHGYLGIGINDVTPDNSRFFELKDSSGALVTQVSPDSPASRGGLRVGDVITQIDSAKVVTASDLQQVVSQHSPNSHVVMHVIRDGKPQTLDVNLGEFHSERQVASASSNDSGQGGRLGVAVSDIPSAARSQLHIPPHVEGAIVEQVKDGSPAEDAGISRGDVILEVNRHAVHSAEDFSNQVHALPQDKDLLLLVWSNGNASYRVLRPAAATDSGM